MSITKLCRWFGVSRSSFYYRPKPRVRRFDKEVVEAVRQTIDEHPTYGVPRLTARLRRKLSRAVNHKKVRRIVQHHNWQVRKRPVGHRPRVRAWRSRTDEPNQRWAIDATHLFCGRDGWCHLFGIIDCCDRALVGWRLSRTGKARVAAAALEEALRARGIRRGDPLVLRSDNGLVFGAKAFVALANRYELEQEYITPHTPEQNGMIERFFRSLKEECVWQHRFENREHAFRVVGEWIEHYNHDRPHSALGYKSPIEYGEKLAA